MYTKEQIWSSFANELRIIRHLAEKIPADQHHHKPTEKQRTMLELLQYLSMVGTGIFDTILSADGGAFARHVEVSKSVTVETFIESIDKEEADMKAIFSQFTDENLGETISAWGMTVTRAEFLLNALKILTSYKMQLFLYIKGAGNHSIGTSNLWAGMDTPTPTA